jgi:hypothetical protein
MSTFDITQMGTKPDGNSSQSDLLGELVGEGKKFKTVDDLAKGKLEADSFIERLQTENKALREAMVSDDTPDVVLAKINELLVSKGSDKNTTTAQVNQTKPQESLSKEEVLELLTKREMDQRRTNNVNRFNAQVNKAFGDKTGEVLATRLGELEMDPELFSAMVEKNPEAALRVLGLKESGMSSGVFDSSVNTEAFFGPSGKGSGEKQNFAYFNKLRRELRERYYEPEIQKQVFEARKKLGEDFWK